MQPRGRLFQCERRCVRVTAMSSVFLMGLLTLAGVAVTVWTLIDGRTTVGKGLLRRTLTRSGQPWAFFFEVLRMGIFTLILAVATVFAWVRAKGG